MLYELIPVTVKLEVYVFERFNEWLIVQPKRDPWDSPAFIYNTKEEKCYGSYDRISDNDELTDDWYRLTGQENPNE